jgi:predicted PurR-regulated permease PerM
MDERAVEAVGKDETEEVAESGGKIAGGRRMEAYMQITAVATSLIVLAILSLLLYFIRGVVIVFALAFLVAYILSPAVRFFEKRRVNRVLVVSLFFLAFVAAVVLSVVFLLPMILSEVRELLNSTLDVVTDPEFGKKVLTKWEAIQGRLAERIPQLKNVSISDQLDIEQGVSGITSWMRDYIGQLIKAVTTFSGRLIWFVIVMILIPFITFFLLKDGESIKRATLRIIPARYSETSLELLQKVDRQIGRYIRGRIAESLILSVLTIIGLWILDIKYYLVIGSIAGFANLIPYIGPVIIAIPPMILAAYQHGMFHMVVTGIFLGSLQIVDNAILVPLVVGKSVDLHPIVTIFVVFVGGQLLGFLGMIVAVPLTSIIIAIFQAMYKEFGSSSAPA